MKKHVNKIVVMMALFMAIAAAGYSQVVVSVRPEYGPVIVRRPPPPSPRHVWIEGEWVERGGRYEKVPGYWAVPGPGFHRWVPGRWVARRHGWVWIPGHWVR